MSLLHALPILPNLAKARPDFALGPRSLAGVRLLRLSVTDRCNLRCVYCMPESGTPFAAREDLLSATDFEAVAGAALSAGVTHLKITGGEPTVRQDLVEVVSRLAALGPEDLSMTTNGLLLERLALPLRRAGLHRLTVSLDTLDPERLARIGRGAARDGAAALAAIHRGLDAAVQAGFEHLKLNVVVMAGINDDEVVRFARLTLTRPWTVRFIEYMPLGDSTLTRSGGLRVDNALVRAAIEQALGELRPTRDVGVGPAEVFALPHARGRVGFISAMSHPFCATCNRLRLTARGELRSCLFDGGEVDVLPALRPHPQREAILRAMRDCLTLKPDVHSDRGNRAMSQLGG